MAYSVIIIGGGFSGLVLANLLADKKIDFLLLERNDRLGKKILSTGNGRGNVSNVSLSPAHYHCGESGFVDYALKNADNGLIARFFEERGVLLSAEDERIYPCSRQANSLLDALRLPLQKASGTIKTGAYVDNLTYDHTKNLFVASVGGERFYAKKVAVCVGGKSAPHMGTDGTSYDLIRGFGHKITQLFPSLVQLKTLKEEIKGLKGVKTNARVYAMDGGRVITFTDGDILFTDQGISGNTVFYLSSYLIGAKKPEIKVDFLYDMQKSDVAAALRQRRKNLPYTPAEGLLSGVMHSAISRLLMNKICPSAHKMTAAEVSDSVIESVIADLNDYRITVTGSLGFDYSQVTRGGVDVSAVDDTTMQSKLIKGLYFAGEVLDVDGDCGGFNLQWAFSSAMCAYRSIIVEL